MRLSKLSIATAALLGALAVISGALGAHALEKVLTPEQLDSYETAVRFQMYHALAILALGALSYGPKIKGLATVYWLWVVGTVLFSGSIYLLVLSPIKVGIVTPIGGVVLIAGWIALFVWALRRA
ncbi:MAG: DUF423 domain-containing protein [Bacteroidota bacterium]